MNDFSVVKIDMMMTSLIESFYCTLIVIWGWALSFLLVQKGVKRMIDYDV